MDRNIPDTFKKLSTLPEEVRLNLLEFLSASMTEEGQMDAFLRKIEKSAAKHPVSETY